MKCAILCGGLATRLRPLTDHMPKSLVDVNGKAFLFHQFELLKTQGVTDVVLCLGHYGNDIAGATAIGYDYGLHVEYSHDGDQLLGTGGVLGTAGALRNALPFLGDMFYVLYGDSYLDGCHYRDVAAAFKNSGRLAMMTVCRSNRSNAIYADGQIMLYDKRIRHPYMAHIDYGLSVMHRSALDGDESDLADVYHKLSQCKQLAGYEVQSKYHSIGSFEGLEETRNYLKGKQ